MRALVYVFGMVSFGALIAGGVAYWLTPVLKKLEKNELREERKRNASRR